jgi:hypothetical protein
MVDRISRLRVLLSHERRLVVDDEDPRDRPGESAGSGRFAALVGVSDRSWRHAR